MNIYGVLIGTAVIIGIELFRRKNTSLKETDILLILLSTLIGARLLFLLHNISEISEGIVNPFKIWDGGLAIYGALIGLIISLYMLSKRKKIPFFKLSDSLFLFLPLLQAIGRVGNFFNHELYGKPSNLPWSIYIPVESRLHGYESYSNFHPAFLYESVLNILLFTTLLFINRKKPKKGYITGAYLISYSIIRLLLNTVRIDKEYIYMIETSNLLSAIFICIGILILMSQSKFKKQIANFFSKTVTISLILLSFFSILLTIQIPTIYLLLFSFLTFLVPISAILLFKRLGITSDYNVTKRKERPKLFFVFLISFFLSLLLSIKLGNIQLITIFSVLNLTFFLGFLITLYWKISFHMIWSTLAIFIIYYLTNNPYLLLLGLLIPFIGWSRIELKKHTLIQVVAGVLLCLLCMLFVLTLLKF